MKRKKREAESLESHVVTYVTVSKVQAVPGQRELPQTVALEQVAQVETPLEEQMIWPWSESMIGTLPNEKLLRDSKEVTRDRDMRLVASRS